MPPAELPDLRGKVTQIAIDTEGRDEGINTKRGSGWPTRDGHLSGLSAAWREGEEVRAFYAPTRHDDSVCFAPAQVAQWLRDHIAAGVRFITHHGAHDYGWLRAEWDVVCPQNIADTEAMAMLVDENQLSYQLDRLCKWRGLPGKDERQLNEAAATYGIDPKGGLWRMPARFIGPYAEQDARATLLLAESLMREIDAQDLSDALQLEHDLMPMVLEMRRRGIRVNTDNAEQAYRRLAQERDAVLAELARNIGRPISIEDCRSARILEGLFQEQGIPIKERTAKTGQASFSSKWMLKHEHWLPRLVARAEQLTEGADKFIKGFILNFQHNGRIYASINQYRGEEGGTRSYRFSYAAPPLQQAPARDAEMASVFRGSFEPEEGEVWLSADCSQQEYRLIVHYATLSGCTKAEQAAQLYRDDASTDFHQLVADWTGLARKRAKDTNFAKAFGAGIEMFASMIESTEDRARAIMAQYDREMPFVKELSDRCMQAADERGYVRLLDGARSHFDMWERDFYQRGIGYVPPVGSRVEAQAKWPGVRLRRAYTHKAMNRLIQGSAARQTKMWMRACWREGYVPLLMMHDELCLSVGDVAQTRRICELGREAAPLVVPMKVDAEIGLNWGEAKHDPEVTDNWLNRRTRASNEERRRLGLSVD